MKNRIKPVVIKWYERLDNREIFEVIAVDEIDGIVDIQNPDGEVAELDMKTWHALRLQRINSPEWNERAGFYESNTNLTIANSIWESWQHTSQSMH